MPQSYPICIFKGLYSDINYLPKKLLKSWLKSAKSPLPVEVHRASLASHGCAFVQLVTVTQKDGRKRK